MTTPFKYQLTDVRRIHQLGGRVLVGWEMGLGKSYLSLFHALRHPELRPIVVICPASIKYQWERECKIHTGMLAKVLEGTRPDVDAIETHYPVWIVNYDILGQRQGEKYGEGWLSFLKSLKPQLVILDEIHYTSNRTAHRAKWSRELCSGVPSVLGLSGTPLTNRPAELWSPLNIIRPDLFPSFWSFVQRYTQARRTRWGWDFRGASNIEELAQKLAPVMIRRRTEDVLADLPTQRRSVIHLEMDNRHEYNKALTQFRKWLEERVPDKARSALRAETLTKLGYLKRLAAHLKLRSVFEWIDNFLEESDGKIILFAVHTKIIDQLKERYNPISVVVTGSVTGRDRQHAVDKFVTNNRTRIFIGNIKAAGVGWSAKGCSDVAFVEVGWTPGEHTQAERRVYGIGRGERGRGSNAWYLVARDTIETSLIELLQRKQKTITAILDNGKGENFDVVEELMSSLLKGSPVKNKRKRR